MRFSPDRAQELVQGLRSYQRTLGLALGYGMSPGRLASDPHDPISPSWLQRILDEERKSSERP